MPHPSTFKFFVPFTRAFIDKSTNKMVVEGLASTTEVDLTGEKMAESAIKSMAASNLPLSFRSEHKDDWDAELGEVVSLSATEDHQLLMKAELDADHPNAHFLFGKLQKGSQLGLSIGGQVNDWAWEHDPQIGRSIRTYKDIALKEVSVTSHPAVASTFLAAIKKSLNSQDPPMKPSPDTTETIAPEAPNLEPADEAIVEQVPEQTAETEIVNPLTPETPTERPTEVTETPGETHGNAPEVEKQDDKAEAESAPEQEPEQTTDEQITDTEHSADIQEQPETPDADEAGHQEASSTEETQPDATTTEKAVTKAQYLSEWAEANATAMLIANIADDLSWRVWGTISDEESDAGAKTATVDAMLAEFHTLILRVATTLIEHQATADPDAAKALQAKRTELTKSLTEQSAEIETVKKTLAERDEELTATKAQLQETQSHLEAANARKARVYSPFSSMRFDEEQPKEAKKSVREAWMADMGLQVERNADHSAQ